MLATYKLEREFLSLLEEPQLRLFENEFKIKKEQFLGIKYEKRGYTVNDKIEQILIVEDAYQSSLEPSCKVINNNKIPTASSTIP